MVDRSPRKVASLTHRAIRGMTVLASTSLLQSALQIFVIAVLARHVSPAEFGVVGAAMVVFAIGEIVAKVGIGAAIVQRPDLQDRHVRTGFTLTVATGLAMSLLVYASADVIMNLFAMPGLDHILRALSPIFVIRNTSVVAEALLVREMRFKSFAAATFGGYVIGFCGFGLTLALLGYGVTALVAAHIARLTTTASIALLISKHPKLPQFDLSAARQLLYFGGGHAIARAFNVIAQQADSIVVGRVLGAETLGVYGRAQQIVMMPTNLFGQAIHAVFFPAFSRVQAERARLASSYCRATAATMLLAAPMAALAICIAPEIVSVLLGRQWDAAVGPLRVLAVGILFQPSLMLGDSLAKATSAVYERAWRKGVHAVLMFAGAWVGSRWGLESVAAGIVGARAIHYLMLAQLTLRLSGASWSRYVGAHWPGVVTGLFIFVVAAPMAWWLRSAGQHDLVTILAVVAAAGATVMIAFRFAPCVFLGRDGVWSVEQVERAFPPLRRITSVVLPQRARVPREGA